MKVKSIILCLMMATVSFAGCLGNNDTVITEEGDPVVPGELPDDWPTYYVATANDLPTCDANTLGRLYYVEADVNFQACMSTGWQVVTLGGGGTTPTLTVNQPPIVSVEIWLGNDDLMTDDGDGTWTQHYFLDWYSLDLDGSIASIGVDYDDDGVIDYPFPSNVGVLTNEVVEMFGPGEYLNGSVPIPMEAGNTFHQAEEWGDNQCTLIWSKRMSVIAIDNLGAITTSHLFLSNYIQKYLSPSEVMNWENDWPGFFPASDIAWLSSPDCDDAGTNNVVEFNDHPESLGFQTPDALLIASFTGADSEDLYWNDIIIEIENQNGDTRLCSSAGTSSAPSSADCIIWEDPGREDDVWDSYEEIEIESDICEGMSSCVVTISMTYQGEPVTLPVTTIQVT